MICPKCKLDKLTEEKDMVICSNCGFKATLEEYNISKHIKPNPEKGRYYHVNHENEEIYSEQFKNIIDLLNKWYIQVLVFVVLLVIVVLIFASM